MLTPSGMYSPCCTSSCSKSINIFELITQNVLVSARVSNCYLRQPQSDRLHLHFFCVLAVAPLTPMMGDDNTRAFSVNLCILSGSARKVPRALFNHMLLHTFSPWWKQLENVKEDSRKITFFSLVYCCYMC